MKKSLKTLKPNNEFFGDFLEGIMDGLVFAPVYLAAAVPFAIMGKLMGLNTLQIVLWSAALFAGASQLACLNAMALGGVSFAELMLITFMVNIRHGFVAFSIVPYLRGIGKKVMLAFCFGIVSSSAGTIPLKSKRGGSIKIYGLTVQFCQYAQWVLFTLLSSWLGPMIPTSLKRIVAFSIPAVFMGLLAQMVRGSPKPGMIVAVTAGVLGLGFTLFMTPQRSAIIATVVSACVGLLVREKSNA